MYITQCTTYDEYSRFYLVWKRANCLRAYGLGLLQATTMLTDILMLNKCLSVYGFYVIFDNYFSNCIKKYILKFRKSTKVYAEHVKTYPEGCSANN